MALMTRRMQHAFSLATILYIALVLPARVSVAQEADAPQVDTARVRAVTVVAEAIRGRVEVVGTLRAHMRVDVATELGGTVERLAFERGDTISSGQLLAEINTSSIALEVRQAEAAVAVASSELEKVETGSRPEEIEIASAGLDRAQAQARDAERHFQRIKDLFDRQAVSDSEFDTASRALEAARADVVSQRERLRLARKGPRREDRKSARARHAQAEAALAVARDRLRKSRIRAPSSGIASFRRVEVGEVVPPGTVITRITDTSRMKVRMSVAERDLPLLEKGGVYRLSVDALPGETFPCKLVFVSPTADPETRAFPVELRVEEHDPRMADGMTARVVFPLRSTRKRIRIPSTWLAEDNGHIGVFVLQNRQARFVPVELGNYYERRVEILTGLEPGDRVIATPSGLRDGQAVQVETIQ
ncbi:MAG: efflux RND transporter periplasmic adaptor subunit [Desulfobacteraceae bacterium]|jgi:multidrug efflux pump subunit AcrA (membrane-fusion protein)